MSSEPPVRLISLMRASVLGWAVGSAAAIGPAAVALAAEQSNESVERSDLTTVSSCLSIKGRFSVRGHGTVNGEYAERTFAELFALAYLGKARTVAVSVQLGSSDEAILILRFYGGDDQLLGETITARGNCRSGAFEHRRETSWSGDGSRVESQWFYTVLILQTGELAMRQSMRSRNFVLPGIPTAWREGSAEMTFPVAD